MANLESPLAEQAHLWTGALGGNPHRENMQSPTEGTNPEPSRCEETMLKDATLK